MFELLLSTLSDSGRRQKRTHRVAGRSSLTSSSNQNVPDSEFSPMKTINLSRPKGSTGHLTSVNLVSCLAIASLLIQSGEAKPGDFDTQLGKPCICNSTFYKACPPARECIENDIPDDMAVTTTERPDYDYDGDLGSEPKGDFHDYDPDHVSSPYGMDSDPFDSPRYEGYDDNPGRGYGPYDEQYGSAYPVARKPYDSEVPPSAIGGKYANQPDRIMRRRKVYLSRKQPAGDLPIIPIKIRIPLSMPEYAEPNLPAPKPLFKYKKYTTYESRPEIQMVPVTKTIIKPVGVSPDQIIEDNSGTTKKRLPLKATP